MRHSWSCALACPKATSRNERSGWRCAEHDRNSRLRLDIQTVAQARESHVVICSSGLDNAAASCSNRVDASVGCGDAQATRRVLARVAPSSSLVERPPSRKQHATFHHRSGGSVPRWLHDRRCPPLKRSSPRVTRYSGPLTPRRRRRGISKARRSASYACSRNNSRRAIRTASRMARSPLSSSSGSSPKKT